MAILDGRDLSTCRRFPGYLADRSICTSQVELDETHRRLWIRLASVSRFSVALDRTATELLIDALAQMGTCAVRCDHERGPHLLGAHPNRDPSVIPVADRRFTGLTDGGPMRLYLHLGADDVDRIDVTFTRSATTALIEHLLSCHTAMAE